MLPPKTWTLRLQWACDGHLLYTVWSCRVSAALLLSVLWPCSHAEKMSTCWSLSSSARIIKDGFFFKDLVDIWGLRHSDKEGSVSSRSAAVSLGRPGFDLLCWFFLLFPFSRLCLLDYSEYKTHWSRFHYSCQRIVRRLAPISRLSYI